MSCTPTSATRAFPESIAARLAAGTITRIRVIGQGTAAVAGQSTAAILDELCDGSLDIDAITATELSGFSMRLDMSDTLAIAVSQSGTTTDTNRTVDLLRGRGAAVLGIVNRRGSDLVDKADGILYTSDGRDVEMSVASTKAFYAQVAAGALLACAISEAAGLGSVKRRDALLDAPALDPRRDARRSSPSATTIADAARRFAPSKRYWAVVGNGPNRVAAEEIRIKLSELCYKSIACDATEDKKHIDLSSEPLILVCAAGLRGSTADDVAKETAIFRAHKATPIVVADEGDDALRVGGDDLRSRASTRPSASSCRRWSATSSGTRRRWRSTPRRGPCARPAKRSSVQSPTGSDSDEMLVTIVSSLPPMVERYLDALRDGYYDGHLEASTAVRLSGLLRDLMSEGPVEAYQRRSGKVGTPAALIEEVVTALTHAIEELTRPIDAIKHQAKTVTVGISPQRRGHLAPRPRAGRAGAPAPGATCSATARSRCSPTSTPRSTRSSASRGTASTARRSPSSIGAGSPATCPVGSSATRNWSAPSAASPTSATCSSPGAAATAAR